jgi:hypothetical protein
MYPDVQGFIDLLKTLDEHPFAPARELFDRDRELIVTRAPGRLDVMGGIADCGSDIRCDSVAAGTTTQLRHVVRRRTAPFVVFNVTARA